MKIKKLLFSAVVLLVPLGINATNGIMSGAGTESNPYLIQDYKDLQAIGSGSGSVYRLARDVSASNSHYTNGQFYPIRAFKGTFHGGGHKITDLYIQSSIYGTDSMGLFAVADTGAVIESLSLVKAEISGRYYVGAIAGKCRGVISNCTVDSASVVKGNGNVGGLVGSNSGKIYHSTYQGSVSSAGLSGIGSEFGALVGSMSGGTIDNCFTKGGVSGSVKNGGFVGHLIDGIIRNCASGANVSGDVSLGGFVGIQDGGIVRNCFSEGNIYGEQTAGGFVGSLNNGIIQNSFAEGNTIMYSFYSASFCGGFAGDILDGTVKGCRATGNVSGRSSLGGFVGHMTKGTITKCSARGMVDGVYDSIGGFVGSIADGFIEKSVSEGTVSGRDVIGGFAGINRGNISLCTATGNGNGKPTGGTAGSLNSVVGGFTGVNRGIISNCGSTGSITIIDTLFGWDYLGGFAGVNSGIIQNCLTKSNVSIDSSTIMRSQFQGSTLSGFTGYNSGTIQYSYAAGNVLGYDTSMIYSGFAGYNDAGTITDCYWDTETTGRSTGVDSSTVSVSVFGKTTAEMKKQSTFINWDFTIVWSTLGDSYYPSFVYVNHAPEILVTSWSTDENITKVVELKSLVSDADRDSVCLRILDPVKNGNLVIDSTTIQYSPFENFNGEDSLRILVSDGVLSDTAWISITVGLQVAIRDSRVPCDLRNGLSIIHSSKDILDISFTTSVNGHAQFEVYSLNGRNILSVDQGVVNAGIHQTSIITSRIKPGIYSVVLRINGKVFSKARLVKYR